MCGRGNSCNVTRLRLYYVICAPVIMIVQYPERDQTFNDELSITFNMTADLSLLPLSRTLTIHPPKGKSLDAS